MKEDFSIIHDPARYQIATEICQVVSKIWPNAAEQVELEGVYQALEKPPQSHLGDYAFPCFRFAKHARKKPADIAENIKDELCKTNNCDWIGEIKVVGAFLNIFTNKNYFAKHTLKNIILGKHTSTLEQNRSHQKNLL